MRVQPIDTALAEKARRLWPTSEELQRRWMRAVQMARRTKRGWLAESRVMRKAA